MFDERTMNTWNGAGHGSDQFHHPSNSAGNLLLSPTGGGSPTAGAVPGGVPPHEVPPGGPIEDAAKAYLGTLPPYSPIG